MLSPEIEITFADGDYLFALKLPQLAEVEEKCGFVDRDGNRRKRGIVAIYRDIRAGIAVVDGEIVVVPSAGEASALDCREVIRLGLIGGGRGTVNGKEIKVTPNEARSLLERYIDPRPVVEWWTLAAAILRAAVEGYEPPKAEPAKAPAKRAGGSARKRRSTSAKSPRTAG